MESMQNQRKTSFVVDIEKALESVNDVDDLNFYEQWTEQTNREFVGNLTQSVGEINFITGSKYEGTWDDLGMAGVGRYTMPNGAVYEGELRDGYFHGHGTLEWPRGPRIDGVWIRGNLQKKRLTFADGLVFKEENWDYCQSSDQRTEIYKIKDGCSKKQGNGDEVYVHHYIKTSDQSPIHLILPASTCRRCQRPPLPKDVEYRKVCTCGKFIRESASNSQHFSKANILSTKNGTETTEFSPSFKYSENELATSHDDLKTGRNSIDNTVDKDKLIPRDDNGITDVNVEANERKVESNSISKISEVQLSLSKGIENKQIFQETRSQIRINDVNESKVDNSNVKELKENNDMYNTVNETKNSELIVDKMEDNKQEDNGVILMSTELIMDNDLENTKLRHETKQENEDNWKTKNENTIEVNSIKSTVQKQGYCDNYMDDEKTQSMQNFKSDYTVNSSKKVSNGRQSKRRAIQIFQFRNA